MKDIQELRSQLDGIDREIIRLLEERLTVSRDVARWKMERSIPVLDAAREAQVLESRAGMLEEEYLRDHLRDVFEKIMAMSRAEQERILKEEGNA